LPALLRLVIFAGTQIVGDVGHNVVKIRLDGRAISFLEYDAFDDDPHPRLLHSVRVYLPKASYDIRDYTDSTNPPILHRKDALVARNYPSYELFRALTQAEEAFGLLSHPDIGYRQSWQRLLAELGIRISGHGLTRA
jgi:DNA phosphorothioation-associated putative methyltransferase